MQMPLDARLFHASRCMMHADARLLHLDADANARRPRAVAARRRRGEADGSDGGGFGRRLGGRAAATRAAAATAVSLLAPLLVFVLALGVSFGLGLRVVGCVSHEKGVARKRGCREKGRMWT